MPNPYIEERVREFREKMWSPKNKMGSALWHDDMQDASCEWFRSALSATYLQALSDVRREMPKTQDNLKFNPGTIERIVYVDGHTSCHSATLSAITRLEAQVAPKQDEKCNCKEDIYGNCYICGRSMLTIPTETELLSPQKEKMVREFARVLKERLDEAVKLKPHNEWQNGFIEGLIMAKESITKLEEKVVEEIKTLITETK